MSDSPNLENAFNHPGVVRLDNLAVKARLL